MTATTSTSKKSFFGVHFRNKITENKKLLIVNSILELIGLPVIAIIILYETYLNEHKIYYGTYDSEAILVVSIIAIVISVLCGILIALFSFKYLYKKSLVDMNYSLPLTSRQRFFADYLSGLTIYIVPVIAAALLSLIILGVGSTFIDLSDFWEYFPKVLSAGIAVVIGMIMLYTLSVFTTTFCGSAFEANFSALAINVVIPASVLCVFLAVTETSNFGLTSESILYNPFMTATSPAGIAVFFVTYLENIIYTSDSFVVSMYFRWLVPTILMLAVYIFGGYMLYKKRKAESVSKPYVYKAIYYVIITLSVFCILSSFIVYENSLPAGLIICGILYFLLEVISKRGFKRFWVSIIRYFATVAAVFVFCNVCESTNGFGASKYVPGNFSVSSVSLNYYCNGFYVDDDIIFNDKNVIAETLDLQKELIDVYYSGTTKGTLTNRDGLSKHQDNSNEILLYDGGYLTISYYLKNGSTVMRNYNITSDETTDLVTSIMLSDEYAEYKSEELLRGCIDQLKYVSNTNISKDNKALVTLYDKLMSNDENSQVISYSQMCQLKEAYKQDLIDMTEEELKTASEYGYLYSSEFWIKDTFTNTINILSEFGFEDNELTEYSLKNLMSGGLKLNVVDEVFVYHGSEYWNEYANYNYAIQDSFSVFSKVDSVSYKYIATINQKDIENDLVELFQKASIMTFDNDIAGAVYVYTNDYYNNRIFFLPDTAENRELIEDIREKYIIGKTININDKGYSYSDDVYYQ